MMELKHILVVRKLNTNINNMKKVNKNTELSDTDKKLHKKKQNSDVSDSIIFNEFIADEKYIDWYLKNNEELNMESYEDGDIY
jgi:hypothetical protein